MTIQSFYREHNSKQSEVQGPTWQMNYCPDLGGYLDAGGIAVPADGTAGYAATCLFRLYVAGGAHLLYYNQGTGAACDFDAVTVA